VGDVVDNAVKYDLECLRYTDVDYDVFSDAATHVRNGFGSPYARKTYRYTPLVAYICTLNNFYHPLACKVVFCTLDIVAAALYWAIIGLQFKTALPQTSGVMAYVSCWAWSPVTVAISTRGSNDVMITVLVLLSVFLILRKWYVAAGIVYGLSIHFKIYPIMYSFVFYFFIDCDKSLIASGGSPYKAIVSKNGFFTRNRLVFTFFTVVTLVGLTGVFYYIYGWEFLYEANLYHLVRKDHRHNNSIYFYLIYQLFDEPNSTLLGLLMFLPQAAVVLLSGFLFYYDLFFAMLLQTWSFVIFCKVMTAQYYLWYLAIMPLAAVNNRMSIGVHVLIYIIWLLG